VVEAVRGHDRAARRYGGWPEVTEVPTSLRLLPATIVTQTDDDLIA
jgi:hypothetical protein